MEQLLDGGVEGLEAINEGEGDAGGSTDGAACENEGLVGGTRVDGEEAKQFAEGAAVAGRERGLEEEGLVAGDGEAKLGADDLGKLGDGVREGGGVGVGCGGGRAGGGRRNEGVVGEGGVVVDEREEQRGAIYSRKMNSRLR